MPKQAVLEIKYTENRKLKTETQGKYFTSDDSAFFIFTMKYVRDKEGNIVFYDNKPLINKLWRNFPYPTFSIARQIFQAFKKLPRKEKPFIVANLPEANMYWIASYFTFSKYGFEFPYGGHRQRLLSSRWQEKKGQINEPHQLPVISLDKWLKGASSPPVLATSPLIEDFSIPNDVRMRLKEVFNKEIRYA